MKLLNVLPGTVGRLFLFIVESSWTLGELRTRSSKSGEALGGLPSAFWMIIGGVRREIGL